MNKKLKIYISVWAVIFALFNVITFVIPNEIFDIKRFESTAFWVSFGLIAVSFLIQLVSTLLVVKKGEKVTTLFNLPVLTAVYSVLVFSFVVGLIFVVVSVLPTWIGAMLCCIATIFLVVYALLAKPTQENINFIRFATAETEIILSRAQTLPMQTEIKKVYEAFRYSDPMSNDTLAELESQLDALLKDLRVAVDGNNVDETKSIVDNMLLLIKERNIRCKACKQKI